MLLRKATHGLLKIESLNQSVELSSGSGLVSTKPLNQWYSWTWERISPICEWVAQTCCVNCIHELIARICFKRMISSRLFCTMAYIFVPHTYCRGLRIDWISPVLICFYNIFFVLHNEVIQIWNDMRVSNWCQTSNFYVNHPFKAGEMV